MVRQQATTRGTHWRRDIQPKVQEISKVKCLTADSDVYSSATEVPSIVWNGNHFYAFLPGNQRNLASPSRRLAEPGQVIMDPSIYSSRVFPREQTGRGILVIFQGPRRLYYWMDLPNNWYTIPYICSYKTTTASSHLKTRQHGINDVWKLECKFVECVKMAEKRTLTDFWRRNRRSNTA